MAVQKIKVAYIDSSGSTTGQVVSSNGTSVFWSEAAAGVNAAAAFNWTGNHNFSANLTIGATGELIVTAGAGIYANGSLGTSGQYLSSNGSSIFWITPSGGGATLSDETASATTHYPAMSTTTSGSWSAAKVSTTKLYFTPSTGQLNATIFNSLSDERVKKDIVTFDEGLNTVNNMRGVKFNWIETSEPSIGIIAQEVEKLLPELVHTGQNGEKSVNYGGIVGVLVEAIKELSARIDKLEGK